jgi:RNA polymerase-interacting CarD/CdnL/TRCF family regulator
MRLDYITNMVISSDNNKKNVENSKIKKENKDAVDSTKKSDISLSSSILTELNNKEKEQLSYYEKQVLKELKGIRKTSKNILKSIKKVSN